MAVSLSGATHQGSLPIAHRLYRVGRPIWLPLPENSRHREQTTHALAGAGRSKNSAHVILHKPRSYPPRIVRTGD